MNVPFIEKYPFDPTGLAATNLVPLERHTVDPSGKTKILAALEGPFFVDSLSITDSVGATLEKWVDYQPVHLFPEATKATGGKACTGFIRLKNESLAGDLFLNYQVVGGQYRYNTMALVDLLWAAIHDGRAVLWQNITNLPATFPPSYHTHDIYTDTYGWDARTAFVTWIAETLGVGNVNAAYQGFEAKRQGVLAEITALGSAFIANVDQHEARLVNPHVDTKKLLGYSALQNFATASDLQALEGTRGDLRLTVKGASDILSNALESYQTSLMHQGVLPVTRFGNLNFLEPDVSGSFEGASMIDVFDRYVALVENDGTLIRLRPGTNGSTVGLYYDYISNIHRDTGNAEVVYTNNRYRPSSLNQNYIPARLVNCDSNVMVGQMYPIAAFDPTNVKWWVALTNGTLDVSKHNCAEIANPTFTQADGSTQTIDAQWGYAFLAGSRVYVLQRANYPNGNNLISGTLSGTAPLELMIGYLNVADVIAGGSVNFTQITTWNTNNQGVNHANGNIQLYSSLIGAIGADSPVVYGGNNTLHCIMRDWLGSTFTATVGTDGLLHVVFDIDLELDMNNVSQLQYFVYRLTIDPTAKTAVVLDTLVKEVITDNPTATFTIAPLTNGNGLNYDNFGNGYPGIQWDARISKYITSKGLSIATVRTGLKALCISKINGFTTVADVLSNPGAFTYTLLKNLPDAAVYGSAVTTNQRSPMLFPGNVLAFYNSDPSLGARWCRTPLVGNPTFAYNIIGIGAINGFAPSSDRAFGVNPQQQRTVITEIDGSNIVTHMSAPSDFFLSGLREITADCVMSGELDVSQGELDAQAARLLAQWGYSGLPFFAELFIPKDVGCPVLLKVLTYVQMLVSGTQSSIGVSLIATVTFAGNRLATTFTGFTANVADSLRHIYTPQQGVLTGGVNGVGHNYYLTNVIIYKLNGEYLITLGGSGGWSVTGPGFVQGVDILKASNGAISGNASSFYTVDPYINEYSQAPIALPGQGFYLGIPQISTVQGQQAPGTYALPGFKTPTAPSALIAYHLGTDYATLVDLKNTAHWVNPIVFVSQEIEQGWIVYFAEAIPLILNGHEYSLASTSIDLRTISASPANTTFYVYAQTIDTTHAQYVISTVELTADVSRLYLGTVVTNGVQIVSINVTKRSGLGKYQISTTLMGSSIPVSTGLPSQVGSWSQA